MSGQQIESWGILSWGNNGFLNCLFNEPNPRRSMSWWATASVWTARYDVRRWWKVNTAELYRPVDSPDGNSCPVMFTNSSWPYVSQKSKFQDRCYNFEICWFSKIKSCKEKSLQCLPRRSSKMNSCLIKKMMWTSANEILSRILWLKHRRRVWTKLDDVQRLSIYFFITCFF